MFTILGDNDRVNADFNDIDEEDEDRVAPMSEVLCGIRDNGFEGVESQAVEIQVVESQEEATTSKTPSNTITRSR